MRYCRPLLRFSSRSLKSWFGRPRGRPQRLMFASIGMLVVVGLTGCGGSRVVFVDESDGLVRLGHDVRGHFYLWNGVEWELSSNAAHLPEGWYAGSVSYEVNYSEE